MVWRYPQPVIDTQTDDQFNLGTVFLTLAETVPDRDFIVVGERRHTYAETAERSRRLASYLASHGLGVHRERAELAGQKTQVTALIVGSVDTRMAAHVAGRKERPEDIAAAGLNAIRRGLDEVDTDIMAIEVRAAMARDPKALERSMARMLGASAVSTGR